MVNHFKIFLLKRVLIVHSLRTGGVNRRDTKAQSYTEALCGRALMVQPKFNSVADLPSALIVYFEK
jgi:hypothetical protein